jgi:hypothetical protein
MINDAMYISCKSVGRTQTPNLAHVPALLFSVPALLFPVPRLVWRD